MFWYFLKPVCSQTNGGLSPTVNSESLLKRLQMIGGSPPDMSKLFEGLAFSPRCNKVLNQCWRQKPAYKSLSTNQRASCFNIWRHPSYGQRPLLPKGSEGKNFFEPVCGKQVLFFFHHSSLLWLKNKSVWFRKMRRQRSLQNARDVDDRCVVGLWIAEAGC